MPQKDPAKRRASTRDRVRRWRERHRCLNTAEIEERLRQLGGSAPTADHIETLSLDDPGVGRSVDRAVYRDWLQEAS